MLLSVQGFFSSCSFAGFTLFSIKIKILFRKKKKKKKRSRSEKFRGSAFCWWVIVLSEALYLKVLMDLLPSCVFSADNFFREELLLFKQDCRTI